MYSIIKEVLIKGNYELVDVLNKINKLWIEGSLTEEERDELVNLARTNAILIIPTQKTRYKSLTCGNITSVWILGCLSWKMAKM